ncbi:hypothetical protein H7142_03275, partial [Candidatus Saccharibacteria bacterium]|nr:hypothetical protein [Candidatus Saccharibacteria bacterium]
QAQAAPQKQAESQTASPDRSGYNPPMDSGAQPSATPGNTPEYPSR